MVHTIKFRSQKVRYFDEGKGSVIVLLHGFLESLDIWEDFSTKLAKYFRVVSIDLPGHGKTGLFGDIHSMELMVDVVHAVIEEIYVAKITLIGHSMGGYVTMAYLEKYPEFLRGFCLFHSTPLADNEVKKANRELTIEDIIKGKKAEICKSHVPKTFANENVDKFVQQIGFGKIIALNTPTEGIIAALKGMKERADRSNLFKNTRLPCLFIHGKKDNFIPANILNHIELPKNCEVVELENTGHMGFIEEPEKSLEVITQFVYKLK